MNLEGEQSGGQRGCVWFMGASWRVNQYVQYSSARLYRMWPFIFFFLWYTVRYLRCGTVTRVSGVSTNLKAYAWMTTCMYVHIPHFGWLSFLHIFAWRSLTTTCAMWRKDVGSGVNVRAANYNLFSKADPPTLASCVSQFWYCGSSDMKAQR